MIYRFQHPKTGEIKEIYLSPKGARIKYTYGEEKTRPEPIKYFGEDGIEWQRTYEVPLISIDTKINPYSEDEFVRKTMSKNDTVGETWDRAAEMAEKRGEKPKRKGPKPLHEDHTVNIGDFNKLLGKK